MNKSDLEKIVAIAEEGSMAKAAQKLYITQPALSKCLTKVEESLGEALFTRRPNGLSLTYAGECLVKRAYQIMKLYDEVEIEFCELNHMRRGILKIGSAERIGALVLPNLLKRFKDLYPNIGINIVEENSLIPNIYSKVYQTGNRISYYQLEACYQPNWQWAVIYNESVENLTRPSRELYRILCEEGCQLPKYADR